MVQWSDEKIVGWLICVMHALNNGYCRLLCGGKEHEKRDSKSTSSCHSVQKKLVVIAGEWDTCRNSYFEPHLIVLICLENFSMFTTSNWMKIWVIGLRNLKSDVMPRSQKVRRWKKYGRISFSEILKKDERKNPGLSGFVFPDVVVNIASTSLL